MMRNILCKSATGLRFIIVSLYRYTNYRNKVGFRHVFVFFYLR